MKLLYINIVAIIFLFTNESIAQWEKVLDREDIIVFNKPNEDGYSFYRAEALINHPISSVYAFLSDIEKYPEWVNNCTDVEVLSSQKDKAYKYTLLFDMPWPVSNRFSVLQLRITHVSADTILFRSLPAKNHAVEHEQAVEITRFKEEIDLYVIDENTTKILMYGAYDPGGKVPSWLTDKFMKYGPYDAVLNIRAGIDN
jgi:hypothetical protein